MGFSIKGWNDNDFATIDKNGDAVDIDLADKWLNEIISTEKQRPQS